MGASILCMAVVLLFSASSACAFVTTSPPAPSRTVGRRYVASKLSPGGGVMSGPKPTGGSSSSSSSSSASSASSNNGGGAGGHSNNHHQHQMLHQHTAAAASSALQPTKSLMVGGALVGGAPVVDTSRSKNTVTRAVAATSAGGGSSSLYVPQTMAPSPVVPAPAAASVPPPSVLWGEGGEVARGGIELPVGDAMRETLLTEAYQECKRITSIYAKTFYMGTSFLDFAKRSATWAIYVWCRRTDDIVDSPRAIVENTMDADLDQWNRRLDDIWAGKPWDALDATLCDVRARYPTMSIEPYKDMIKGMVMDVPGLGQHRYQTFEELYLYCYRVAGTVGLMTLPIMGTAPGYTEKQATEPALALGIALQLTNILRDVGEDAMRGRIYLPLEDLERFGVTEDQIMNKIMNSNYREMIKFQIARARLYFDKAEDGIMMLSADARLPVRSSLDMYREILNRIEDNDYDNFRHRAYVSKFEKLLILPTSWWMTTGWGTNTKAPK